jgi:lysozyme
MKPIPKAAVDLIKKYEGRSLKAYKCPANIWTCGWGSTGDDIKEGVTWSIWQAEDRLKADLGKFAQAVDRLVTVPITDNQRAALISFSYNVGIQALKESTLLRLLNEGKTEEAAGQFERWNKAAGRVLTGLTARRSAERDLFNKKD